jgi:hypothetical protein
MPVYSKRCKTTRETTKMETEKTKRIKRIVTVSLRGSEKKAGGTYNKIYKSRSRKKEKENGEVKL